MNDTEGYRPNALYRTLASHYRALADMLKRDPLPGMRTTFATITGEIHATGIVDAFRSFARSCYGAERQQADAMPPPPELKRNSRGAGTSTPELTDPAAPAAIECPAGRITVRSAKKLEISGCWVWRREAPLVSFTGYRRARARLGGRRSPTRFAAKLDSRPPVTCPEGP